MDDESDIAFMTSYFVADALFQFESEILQALSNGNRFKLVLGAQPNGASREDLRYVIETFVRRAPSNTEVILVRYDDCILHSKMYSIKNSQKTRSLVTSANFTPRGLTHNVEAGIALTDDANADAVYAAIDSWSAHDAGAEQVSSIADIDALVVRGYLPRASKRTSSSGGGTTGGSGARLGPVAKLKRRRKSRKGHQGTSKLGSASSTSSQPKKAATSSGQYGGIVRFAKILPKSDLKYFRGVPGTPYVALPVALRSQLGMTPPLATHVQTNPKGEPVLDVTLSVELHGSGRVDKAPSGDSSNVTAVGFGTKQTGHRDLRFNVTRQVWGFVQGQAGSTGIPTPTAGDIVVVELDGSRASAKLTFVTDPVDVARLRPHAYSGGTPPRTSIPSNLP